MAASMSPRNIRQYPSSVMICRAGGAITLMTLLLSSLFLYSRGNAMIMTGLPSESQNWIIPSQKRSQVVVFVFDPAPGGPSCGIVTFTEEAKKKSALLHRVHQP